MADLPAQAGAHSMFTVYVIRSKNNNWTYVGLTSNLEDRLKRHNGKREKTTRYYAPFELIFCKEFKSRIEARDFEKFLKIRSNKEKLLQSLK